MCPSPSVPKLHLITDRRLVPSLAGRAIMAFRGLRPGTVALHLREKDLAGRALLQLARTLRRACDETGQLLLLNDRLDVALEVGADGVHLPSAGVSVVDARQLMGATALIGRSCHSLGELQAARADGADYATFSPIFETPSKARYGAPLGLAALVEAAGAGLPIVALGGITPENAPGVRSAGAAGVAAIRAWLEGEDPSATVRALLRRDP